MSPLGNMAYGKNFNYNKRFTKFGLQLDIYLDQLQFAYSLKEQLLSSYTGNIIEVLEDGSDTTKEFKPSTNLPNEILDFCSVNNGYIVGVYDQINGVKTSITTASQQIQIVDTGDYINFTAKYLLEIPQKTLLTISGIACCNRMKNLLMVNYIGFKDQKSVSGYGNDYVYPLNCSAGTMTFDITGTLERLYYFCNDTISLVYKPTVTLPTGVNYLFSLGMLSSFVEMALVGDKFIGNTADLPRFLEKISLNNCVNVTGKFIDLPRVSYSIDLYNVRIDDNVADLPRVSFGCGLTLAINITGAVIDLPRVSDSISIYGANKVTGSFADMPLTRYHRHRNCNLLGGVLPLLPISNYIDVAGTNAMTSNDTDTLLINLAEITTVTSGGQLWIKNNRTSASDAAVASLAGKFTITIA